MLVFGGVLAESKCLIQGSSFIALGSNGCPKWDANAVCRAKDISAVYWILGKAGLGEKFSTLTFGFFDWADLV